MVAPGFSPGLPFRPVRRPTVDYFDASLGEIGEGEIGDGEIGDEIGDRHVTVAI